MAPQKTPATESALARDVAPRRRSRRTIFLATAAILGGLVFAALILLGRRGQNGHAEGAVPPLRLQDIPFNGTRAYEYLKQLCAIGRRPSGSQGMFKQQQLLKDHFEKSGGKVEFQTFRVRHPQDPNVLVPMANMIIRWHPERKERLLLCAHYDTLPYPMLDRRNPRGLFVGANDGASGVALLMELAHDMNRLDTKYGVDFVLFDGEEFIFDENGRFFLGSEYFARDYAGNPPPYRYRWGILLDMIGDSDLQLYYERNSYGWRDTRPLVEHLWAIAQRSGVKEFVPKKRHAIRDDHLPVHNIGRIPCIDVIDFDYPPWHTQGDTPDKCSALSLAKVGWVIRQWLQEAK